ncbi:MAG TPA: hypothetical protein VMI94_19930 [Bryobacteraceae bacterium]|nr:hypothetical protein [Bryobacteraceae bacterium]
MASKRLRQIALAVALAWACWWVFFATAEAFSDGQFTGAVLFFVAMFGAVTLAWKFPVAGAVLLFAESAAALIMYTPMWWRRYHLAGTALMFAWMPLPPLASGVLLLIARRRRSPAAAA